MKEKILEILNRFHIREKVVATTVDNVANTVCEASLVAVACLDHYLNLCAHDVLEKEADLKKMRREVKETGNGMKESLVEGRVQNCQKRLGMQQKVLIPECKTR